MIRVLIVDDHTFFRRCLVDLFASAPDLLTVGECGDGSEVLGSAQALRPHVVLMDVRMPRRSGWEAADDLHRAGSTARVVLMTSEPGRPLRPRAEARGVHGHVTKGADPGNLLEAVRRVAAGGTAWPEDLTSARTPVC